MKSLIYRNPHLAIRFVISLIFQVLLVLLLHRPHQDSLFFNLAVIGVAGLAMAPLHIRPSCLNIRATLILGLVGLLPQVVILATGLHLVGWSCLFDWLLARLQR